MSFYKSDLTNKKMNKVVFTLCVFVVVLIGCTSSKPIESFLLSEGNQLYYLRSTNLNGKGVSVLVDFTYNTTKGKDVICNFTVESSDLNTNKVSALEFVVNGIKDTAITFSVNTLFKDENITRFTSLLSKSDFQKMVECLSVSECSSVISIRIEKQVFVLKRSASFIKAMKSANKILPWE